MAFSGDTLELNMWIVIRIIQVKESCFRICLTINRSRSGSNQGVDREDQDESDGPKADIECVECGGFGKDGVASVSYDVSVLCRGW